MMLTPRVRRSSHDPMQRADFALAPGSRRFVHDDSAGRRIVIALAISDHLLLADSLSARERQTERDIELP